MSRLVAAVHMVQVPGPCLQLLLTPVIAAHLIAGDVIACQQLVFMPWHGFMHAPCSAERHICLTCAVSGLAEVSLAGYTKRCVVVHAVQQGACALMCGITQGIRYFMHVYQAGVLVSAEP